ncbi:MAG: ATP-binding cassette domain-containing protein [Acidobacteriota bacterium]|nr:ATP-binding cassette domain-containing protein [Acidobacteriota bacterium]
MEPTAHVNSEILRTLPVLSAAGIVRRFGHVVALAGVSIDVEAGECVALVGESGSGKSTLLRSFNRLTEPDEGQVTVDGVDVRSLDPVELRRRLGYVPQDGGLLPHWTVARNAALVPWLLGRADAPAVSERALDAVGLPAGTFGGRWPHELSGGQRQRVAIARALAIEPRIVLLDEPFGALDAITRGDLQEMFGVLRKVTRVAAVLVTHDLREAFLLADRIAVMREGRIEQLGTPAALLHGPETPYVATLLARAHARAEWLE